MLDNATIATLGGDIHRALLGRQRIARISETHPAVAIEDAYAISKAALDLRLARGERLTGKKIGLTAKIVQQAVGVDEPDYGFLTSAMEVTNGDTVDIADSLITPMVEAEIALVLKDRLAGPGVTPEQVLAATDYAAPCFEIVDSRFDNPKITIVDTVADNASSALYVLGEGRADPRELDLAAVRCTVHCNGAKVLEGLGEAVMGSPLNSVAWLANRLADFGVALEAGDVVLPGSLVPFAPARAGDRYEAHFEGLGNVGISFA